MRRGRYSAFMEVPFTIRSSWEDVAPGRIAGWVRTDSPEGCGLALLGLPDDLGIRLNNGRPGAWEGPRAFRAALARFGFGYDGVRRSAFAAGIFDAGDVTPAPGDTADALAQTHERVTRAARALHDAGLIVVCVGGGHDLTYPSVRALSESFSAPLGGINVDPHLDVRETPGSGMPYRMLIEGGFVDPRRFVEFGAGRFVNSPEHAEYARGKGVTIVPAQDVAGGAYNPPRAFGHAFSPGPDGSPGLGFVSIDLDCLDASVAPGVSAPCPMGLSLSVVSQVADLAGRCREVRHFDLMELSPTHDDGGRTARVAAMLFVHFVSGFSERG